MIRSVQHQARAAVTYTVCVCTSYSADAEPRAPRHAAAIARWNPEIQVVFVECLPFGQRRRPVPAIDELANIRRLTCHFSTRASGLIRLVAERAVGAAVRGPYRAFGYLHPSLLHARAGRLARMLSAIQADVYVGHNIETLLPVVRASRGRKAATIFDCMEYYSDMGDGQTGFDRELIRGIESACLHRCDLVLASSDQLADRLAADYGIKRPLALYNAPGLDNAVTSGTPGKPDFRLYWRNSTLGFGQRGLEDAMTALALLPAEITLHLQGNLPPDGGAGLRQRIAQLGLDHRVVIHPPYRPQHAVREAAAHSVGLCLERKGNRNHDLTVSNKMFDYMMAGLPVVASDLPGLRGVIERSGGGRLFEAGSVESLARHIRALYDSPALWTRLSTSAREFARREGNLDHEMKKFSTALSMLIGDRTR